MSGNLIIVVSADRKQEQRWTLLPLDNFCYADELADLIDQLGEGGRNVHELEKARKRLELEKEELLAALEETRLLLETEEAKVSRAQLEVVSAKQESERRVIEKEEEIEQLR